MSKNFLISKLFGLRGKEEEKLFVIPKDVDKDLELKPNINTAEDDFLDENFVIKPNVTQSEEEDKWFKNNIEGQLAVDVYDDNDCIVIKSAIAGAKPSQIDISLKNDMLTIRGRREESEKVLEQNYISRECYWGNFSRSIILPCEVYPDRMVATFKNGILAISLPKVTRTKQINIKPIEI